MSSTKPIRQDKDGQEIIQVSTWLPVPQFESLKKFASPDLGSRWESILLRRVIREWLENQAKLKK